MVPKICSICKKEKENVGPKPFGKGYSDDPRLAAPDDVILSKIMCDDCYNKINKK